jgi:hypothetical protein
MKHLLNPLCMVDAAVDAARSVDASLDTTKSVHLGTTKSVHLGTTKSVHLGTTKSVHHLGTTKSGVSGDTVVQEGLAADKLIGVPSANTLHTNHAFHHCWFTIQNIPLHHNSANNFRTQNPSRHYSQGHTPAS